tara:strand:- start:889 stop:1254 length:366 start_codon:yes stop_codon:yes gene_type:complete
MIEIFGEEYYIDFDELDQFLIIENNESIKNDVTTKTTTNYDGTHQITNSEIILDEHIKHKEINGVRFELIRNFISDLSDGAENMGDDIDDTLGSRNLSKMNLRFKLAYNTLLYYNILKKLD